MLMCYLFPLECLQAINRQRVLDRFKSREDNFYDKLEDDLFMDVYAMHAHAQKTHLLASKWGIGNDKQELWRRHANFLQRIIDNVAFNSHGWAVRELKAYFGGEEDLTRSENKAAKKIIKEASKPHHSMQGQVGVWPPLPQFVPPPMMGMRMGPQFPLQPHQMHMQQMQPTLDRSMHFGGVCYRCNQTGHMAKNCPSFARQNPGNFGGRRPFRRGKRN